ncbi:MAG: hypothetical protein JSV26_00460 [bacterium]|nr:MAG: hypothetical protein JSV26_00460 [bacterium]
MQRLSSLMMSLAALALSATTAFPQPTWYLGGGLEFGSVTSDERTLADGTEGSGLVINGGLRFNRRLSMDCVFSGFVTSDLTYGILGLGPRLDFVDLKAKKLTPWASIYLSHHSLEWEGLDAGMEGLGFSAAGGFDLIVGPRGVIQWALRYHPFPGDLKIDGTTLVLDLETATTEVTVSYVYHFW